MNAVDQMDIILSRLRDCPLNLVRVELEMFRNTLESDAHLVTVLETIISRNQQVLGAKAATLAKEKEIASSRWADLSFANSASLRAAVGYQMCITLLEDPNPIGCGKSVVRIGAYYSALRGEMRADAGTSVRAFSEVFLDPLVSYLRNSLEERHRLLFLLSRYKQRGEWFPDDDLLKEASVPGRDLERRLKRDFFRYLFDNGVTFSVESEIPAGGTKVDVLPVLPDAVFFPIEVKVFGDENRGPRYVTDGLAQASDYAKKFRSPEAGYLIYNLAEDTTLSLPGSLVGPGVVSVTCRSVTIYSVSVDLRRRLRASEAGSLKIVNIATPSD